MSGTERALAEYLEGSGGSGSGRHGSRSGGTASRSADLHRWIAADVAEQVRRSEATVLNPHRPAWNRPGSTTATSAWWVDPATGKKHTARAFAMVLPCPRHMFVQPVDHRLPVPSPARMA